MDRQQRLEAFRDLAADLTHVDHDVYDQFDKDPRTPILGEGCKYARLVIFGRDPGRDEVRYGLPFIGAGGQLVRKELYRAFHNQAMPDFAASKAIGEHVFWLNTLPYKPIGNKAWPMAAKKRFQPLIADILLHEWCGHEVITLGREAFFWFGIHQSRALREALKAFWARPDRFQSVCTLSWPSDHKEPRRLRLLPLPHPSPLNAVWYKQFPSLLLARLRALDWSGDHWQCSSKTP